MVICRLSVRYLLSTEPFSLFAVSWVLLRIGTKSHFVRKKCFFFKLKNLKSWYIFRSQLVVTANAGSVKPLEDAFDQAFITISIYVPTAARMAFGSIKNNQKITKRSQIQNNSFYARSILGHGGEKLLIPPPYKKDPKRKRIGRCVSFGPFEG